MAPTSHLLNAGSAVTSATSRLVTTQSHQVPEAVSPGCVFFLVVRFLPPFPNPQLFRFVAGMTACGIELLDDRGKVNVASVQQIAFRDLKHLW